MADYDKIVRDRQATIRRQMDVRRISIKQVQYDGQWESPSTVLSYFPADEGKQPATMSVASLFRLLETGALPADLLSMLLPAGFQIVRAPEEIDHDEMEAACRDYLAAKGKAHHPDSPDGREISSCEDDALDARAARLRAVAA
ncbi:hypothetical protein N6H05_14810 [Sphingobium sp. WTD-1]|uniref:hypothetical protein n=1 Tax=Sphingobium sp. WTD-1 TaxID=2979467 RepID=UPI0024DE88E5|nr:hypothetical protein [Sphingobium sp. WTD-1]WIA54335.1 hypothetical protein N6H05_14810 [Sphingobium sp. WTD-1]